MATLIAQDRHGYDIMRQVALDSDQHLTMGPATLYTSIKRLVELGYMEEAGERPDAEHGDIRRKYYRLTKNGQEVVMKQLEQMEHLTALMRRRLA
jgi:DNA-binding PadR family transcriptional regulator